MHKRGVFSYADGGKYEGEWFAGKRQGQVPASSLLLSSLELSDTKVYLPEVRARLGTDLSFCEAGDLGQVPRHTELSSYLRLKKPL